MNASQLRHPWLQMGISTWMWTTSSLRSSTRSRHLLSSLSSSQESSRKCPATWRITSAASTTSRRLSPSQRPCGALLFMYFILRFHNS
ncbi:hypothetical protein GQ55_5G301000 [Panicum hallii var. hallii]|uniref:Uncharacterized protein n=1 Tax=Panicum hallii var. hallii TaxID=1504633 RepID=A0A2T7DLH9_9POAL|nr:hypothetical protein GQ55_5G301000 [Panicum hallii var. hallii]